MADTPASAVINPIVRQIFLYMDIILLLTPEFVKIDNVFQTKRFIVAVQ
jgi:hypothetical protein